MSKAAMQQAHDALCNSDVLLDAIRESGDVPEAAKAILRVSEQIRAAISSLLEAINMESTLPSTPDEKNTTAAKAGNIAAIRHVAYADGYRDGKAARDEWF